MAAMVDVLSTCCRSSKRVFELLLVSICSPCRGCRRQEGFVKALLRLRPCTKLACLGLRRLPTGTLRYSNSHNCGRSSSSSNSSSEHRRRTSPLKTTKSALPMPTDRPAVLRAPNAWVFRLMASSTPR